VRRVSEPGVRCVFRLSCAERVHFSSALSEPASVSLFVSPPLLVGGAVERAAKSQRGSKYPLSPKGVGIPARICAVRETEALKRAPSRVSVPGPTSGIEGERKGELGSGGCRAFRGVKPPRCAASLGTARSCLLSVSRLLGVRFFQIARSGRWCIEKSGGESCWEDRTEGQPNVCYSPAVLPWVGARNQYAPLGFSSLSPAYQLHWITKLCVWRSGSLDGFN
jgi:hypothetical protein